VYHAPQAVRARGEGPPDHVLRSQAVQATHLHEIAQWVPPDSFVSPAAPREKEATTEWIAWSRVRISVELYHRFLNSFGSAASGIGCHHGVAGRVALVGVSPARREGTHSVRLSFRFRLPPLAVAQEPGEIDDRPASEPAR